MKKKRLTSEERKTKQEALCAQIGCALNDLFVYDKLFDTYRLSSKRAERFYRERFGQSMDSDKSVIAAYSEKFGEVVGKEMYDLA